MSPLPRLEMVDVLGGRRAALILPSGVEDGVMPVVGLVVAAERTEGRSAALWVGKAWVVGLEGSRGDEGEGLPKGESSS